MYYIEDKKNKAIKQLLKSNLIRNMQVFFGFANFFWQFI